MYNPRQLETEYKKVKHGKARISAIRQAVCKAEENHDLAYQIKFLADLCYESCFYEDSMDMLVAFPQALALLDKNPEIPTIPGDTVYKNGLDRMLEVYKWVISCCSNFYQIPLEDCKKFFEDFKKRSIGFGYNLKPYYGELYYFYEDIDEVYSDECFEKFRRLPKDGNGDCPACDRNLEIGYYLKKGELEKANKLAKDIENYTLTCRGSNDSESWLRMKEHYLQYYLEKRDFEHAAHYVKLIQRKMTSTEKKEYSYWDTFLYFYTYTDMGKALKIYKENWKEWQNERCPVDKYNAYKRIAVFFKELEKQRKRKKIKLHLDSSFPLYSEDGEYEISKLRDFYYDTAKDIALKFDKRNGSDSYIQDLKKWYEQMT